MGKILIIAEKPSVMADLGRALSKPLGKFEKNGTGRDTWLENDNAVITEWQKFAMEVRCTSCHPPTIHARSNP